MDLNFVLFPTINNEPPPSTSKDEEKGNSFNRKIIYIDSEEDRKIPCLFIPGRNKRLMIYFHGNGEDLSSCYSLAMSLQDSLAVNVLIPEYPGYGLY